MAQNLGNFFLDAEAVTNVDGTGNHTYSITGTVVKDGVNKYAGEYSYSFPGTSGNYIVVPDHDDFHFGLGDFTIDCWFRRNQTTGHDTFLNIGSYQSSTNQMLFYVLDFGSAHSIYVLGSSVGNFPITNVEPSGFFQNDVWYHAAIVRKDGMLKAYLNGTQIGNVADFTTCSITSTPATGITLGVYGNKTKNPFNGNMDNLRIVKGAALWTSNFDVEDKDAMFYDNPVLVPTSSIYQIGHRGNLRGKAKAGFVRPTIKQFFTSTNWEMAASQKQLVGYSTDVTAPQGQTIYPGAIESGHFSDRGAWGAFDNVVNADWDANTWDAPRGGEDRWVGWNFGAGNEKEIRRIRIQQAPLVSTYGITRLTIDGYDGEIWTTILTDDAVEAITVFDWHEYDIDPGRTYQAYRIFIVDTTNGSLRDANIPEIEMMEGIYE